MGVGIIASPPPDADGDGVTDASDNCPSVSNAGQLDTDGDLAGDACDTDDDGDGLTDAEETGTHGTNPLVADTDGDGWDDFVEVNDGGNPLIWPQGQSVSIAAPNPWQGANGPFPVFADATSMQPVVVTASGPCDVSGAMVVPVAPGTCTLTAAQAGGYLWSPASNSVDIELVQSVQTLTISAPVTMTVDDTITVSATSDSGLGVTLQASGLCDLVGGDLTVTGAGTCTLTASQPGDTWWEPATSTLEVEVVREPQGITIAAPSTMTAGHAAPVTVTTDSALPLSSLVVTGPCALEAGDLLALGAGTCEITAEHAGDDHWEPALATHVVDVAHEAQSIALVAPSAMLATDSVMLEAVADSGLPVAYSVTGPCSLQDDELFADGAGTCTVTAAQAGDERWAPATATADIDVALHPQSIVFGTPIELTVGDSLIVAAWADNGQALTFSVSGPCSIVGDVVTADGEGTCAVTAEQLGDAAWEPATATHLISMSRRAQSITLHVPPSMTSGETATVSATSTSGLPVAVRGAGTCTVIGTSITANDAGTCTVSADQPGDVLWAPAPTATATIVIAPAPTTTVAPDTVARRGRRRRRVRARRARRPRPPPRSTRTARPPARRARPARVRPARVRRARRPCRRSASPSPSPWRTWSLTACPTRRRQRCGSSSPGCPPARAPRSRSATAASRRGSWATSSCSSCPPASTSRMPPSRSPARTARSHGSRPPTASATATSRWTSSSTRPKAPPPVRARSACSGPASCPARPSR